MTHLKFCAIFFLAAVLTSGCAQLAPKLAPQANLVDPSSAPPQQSFFPDSRPGFAKLKEAQSFDELCAGVRVTNLKNLRLTAMEKRLLCGDDKKDVIGVPWSKIPPNQAAYFASGFLQSRGYHQPVFIQDGELLFIEVGEMSRVQSFSVINGPAGWEAPEKRLIKGQPLTPKILDELQTWSLNQIKNEGYACSSADAQADPQNGEVIVHLVSGDLKHILAIETTGDAGLNAAALDRYSAFHLGDVYRDYLIELTRRRIIEDDFLQSILFSTQCAKDGVKIVRDVLLGDAREVRIAAGGSTDAGALVRLTLGQNRIGDSASSAQVNLTASYLRPTINEQTLKTNYKWYYTKGEARSYLQPQIQFDHTAEQASDTRSAQIQLMQGYGVEYQTGVVDMQAGPVWLNLLRTRGVGAGLETPIYIATSLSWKSHEFEYFSTSPRTGEYIQGDALFTLDSLGADYTAQKFQVQGEKLWSIEKYDPPLLILGARFNVSSVFSVGDRDRYRLPPVFLTQAGGDNDLRGFSANTLPRDGLGALSAMLGSLEARLHKVIYSQADTFAFLDSGLLGSANFQLARPLFMSPGLGLRWESIVGVLRVYVAEGFALNEDKEKPSYGQKTRFGFTYGQEF